MLVYLQIHAKRGSQSSITFNIVLINKTEMLAERAASISVSAFALYLWLFGKTAKHTGTGFDRLALVTGLGNVIASLLSGAGNLALIGFFAMLLWEVAGRLLMPQD